MPIPVQDTLIEHVGNGVTTVFSYPFTILSSDDLKCRVDGALVTTGFTVSGVGSRTGGSVTFSSAPASLASVLLYRQVSLDRETDYQENGDLLASVIDDDFDRAWMAIQDLGALNERSLRVPVGEALDDLPGAESRADRILGFDSSGVPILVTTTEDGGAALAIDLASTSDASKGAGMPGYDSLLAYVANTIGLRLSHIVSVKDKQFGAKGDGVTNDSAAFKALGAYVTSIGGGVKVVVPGGSYIVGAQTFAGATGKGYAYQASDLLKITGCTKPVVIEFEGVKVTFASGLKFGSFDPVTGNSYTPGALPFTNADYAADIGTFLFLQDNANVQVTGSLEVDGNQASMSLGGQWGDTGRQRVAYGVLAYGNAIFSMVNAYLHHHCTDGLIIGWPGLTEADSIKPHTIINVVSEYNARQGLSWVGGNNLTAINCKFNHTGKGTFNSSPGAGIDIEPESSICRNGVFYNVEAVNNLGVGALAIGDSADIEFNGGKITGTTNYSVWVQVPRVVFRGITIVGSMINLHADATYPENATVFDDVLITDEVAYGYGGQSYAPGLLVDASGATNALFNRTTIIASKQKLGDYRGVRLFDTNMYQRAGVASGIADKDWIALLWGSTLRNLTIVDQVSSTPANAYYVGFSGTERYSGINRLNSATKIKWFNWDASSGGFAGYLGQDNADLQPQTFLAIGKTNGGRLVGYSGQAKVVFGDALPSTGSWTKGDHWFSTNVGAGLIKGAGRATTGAGNTLGVDWLTDGNY